MLWNEQTEKYFFKEALKSFASPEQLFYNLQSGYYAYIPKDFDSEGQTLQSRNSLIGRFTEKWCKQIFSPIAEEFGLCAINGVVCEEIALTKSSSADLALCTKNTINQKAEDIKLIFEIKMSIVSNYKFEQPDTVNLIGDYKSHKGNPSLLRSDSMLKAIGKSINIRVSSSNANTIPIIILGNSPIKSTYSKKVDFLKSAGVIQGFYSLNPNPTKSDFIFESPEKGFITITDEHELKNLCKRILSEERHYFSSMISKKQLGKIISIAAKEIDDVKKGEKFLKLLRGCNE